MSLQVPALNAQESAGKLDVSESIFGLSYNETLIHQLVTKFLADGRSGTKAQKNRADVSGGGAKPWRQKGTGHARAGTTRGPIWRTGGVTFAAQPRSFKQKLNKKMFRVGIKSIFSELLRQDRLRVSDSIIPGTPKTKELIATLNGLDVKKILIIVEKNDSNLDLASRNIPNVAVTTTNDLSPVLLVSADKVIMTTAAVKEIEERFA